MAIGPSASNFHLAVQQTRPFLKSGAHWAITGGLGVMAAAITAVITADHDFQALNVAWIVAIGMATLLAPLIGRFMWNLYKAPTRRREELQSQLQETRHALDLERASKAAQDRYELRAALVQVQQDMKQLRRRCESAQDTHWPARHFFVYDRTITYAEGEAPRLLQSSASLDDTYSAVMDVYRTIHDLSGIALTRRIEARENHDEEDSPAPAGSFLAIRTAELMSHLPDALDKASSLVDASLEQFPPDDTSAFAPPPAP